MISTPSPRATAVLIDRTDAHTAVVFFSHRPEREWQNKCFVRQDVAKHRQVAATFYHNARQAVAGSNFPVLEFTDSRQRGNGFGARLANAIADAFAEGYQQIIVVGSDCPTLHEVDWTAVAQQLATGTPVLGPTANDEGTYLIGLRREHFERDAFEALPWQSPSLLTALEQHLARRAGTPVERLSPRADVNGHRELIGLLQDGQEIPEFLVYRLRQVLGSDGRCRHLKEATEGRRVSARRSRAPPRGIVASIERVPSTSAVH